MFSHNSGYKSVNPTQRLAAGKIIKNRGADFTSMMEAERAPTEPASAKYFPHVVKYNENGPVDSILSQETYSNSYYAGAKGGTRPRFIPHDPASKQAAVGGQCH